MLLESCLSLVPTPLQECMYYFILLPACPHRVDTTTDYLIANAPSPPVYFEPAVIVYYRRFQMDPAVMLTYHRASPPGRITNRR